MKRFQQLDVVPALRREVFKSGGTQVHVLTMPGKYWYILFCVSAGGRTWWGEASPAEFGPNAEPGWHVEVHDHANNRMTELAQEGKLSEAAQRLAEILATVPTPRKEELPAVI